MAELTLNLVHDAFGTIDLLSSERKRLNDVEVGDARSWSHMTSPNFGRKEDVVFINCARSYLRLG